jgi:L-alanine-DL-glutamate epimerase-like enolase superfamily enzyme
LGSKTASNVNATSSAVNGVPSCQVTSGRRWNVQVVPHGWNTAVGLAADLQFSASIPVARYVEYLTPCAYIDGLTTEPFALDERGMLAIPTRPGLGIELDPEALQRFSVDRVVFS